MKYISLDHSISELQALLQQKGWLSPTETVLAIEKPGEGNMNVVLRVKTSERSFILKQSRPYVQKYQQIEAPLNRIDVEYQFYQAIQGAELSKYIPAIQAYDQSEHLLLMEDLGHCEDLSRLYQSRKVEAETITQLTQILSSIHQSKVAETYPQNLTLRQLNHQHIFVLPFLEDNGFQLDEVQAGLQEISMIYKKDMAIKSVVDTIGKQYLSTGSTLLHGDYYPGSWMTAEEKLYVIDPEFSFLGFAEFDLGVMAAHLVMATSDPKLVDTIFEKYTNLADKKLMTQMAGIEIIRRLIGLAQLPLSRSLEEKASLLKIARTMILS